MNQVLISKKALKSLKQLPKHIVKKLQLWIMDVENLGIEEVRKVPGYHDEPLSRDRENQRSVRLSKSYRGFYIEYEEVIGEKKIDIINVIEVNKHDY